VFTNGSYELMWGSGDFQSFLGFTDWVKFYYNKKPEFARQIVQSQVNADGSRLYRYLNGTFRYFYPPLSSTMTDY
jgi:hypothetical protein